MNKRRRAFSLTEVLLCVILLVAMGIMVAITLSATARSNHQAGGFLVARSLVASKISQLQTAGYTALNGPGLGQKGACIVDGTPTSPTVIENAQGAARATFEFTQTNMLSQLFPATTKAPPQGKIYLAPYTASKQTIGGKDSYPLVRASIQVQWQDTNGLSHTYSQTTLIPRNAL